MKSLFESLGLQDPATPDIVPLDPILALTGKEFCQAIVESLEFRTYIFRGLQLRDIPPAILGRVIDHAWGKPPDRVELTGKDGKPMETVTEVKRVIIRVAPSDDEEQQQEQSKRPYTSH